MQFQNSEGSHLTLSSILGVQEVTMIGGVRQTEERWSQRRSASLPVEIMVSGTTWAISQTRNVSLGGVFIETADKKPSVGSDIDLFFVFNDFGSKTRYRLHAKVVRQANDGFGVTFKDFDTQSFRTLQEIMRHVPLPEGI